MFTKTEKKKIQKMTEKVPTSIKKQIIFNNLWQERYVILILVCTFLFFTCLMLDFADCFWISQSDPAIRERLIADIILTPITLYNFFAISIFFSYLGWRKTRG